MLSNWLVSNLFLRAIECSSEEDEKVWFFTEHMRFQFANKPKVFGFTSCSFGNDTSKNQPRKENPGCLHTFVINWRKEVATEHGKELMMAIWLYSDGLSKTTTWSTAHELAPENQQRAMICIDRKE
jgi:hypothetical protein